MCRTAGSLCSAGATPRPRSYGPIRHPLVFRRFPDSSYTAYLAPPHFETGRGGLLQLLSASLSPCRRCLPRRSGPTREPACVVPMLPSPRFHGLGLRGCHNFEATSAFACAAARGLAPIRLMGLSIGFRSLITLLPAIQATGRLAVALAGLPPAERASLRWTHKTAQNAVFHRAHTRRYTLEKKKEDLLKQRS
jgi:hypothetical protein